MPPTILGSSAVATGPELADALAERGASDTPLRRVMLAQAALAGISGDTLLRDGPTGVGFSLWIATVVLVMIALVWRDGRRVPIEATAWLATAVGFAAGLAWRESELLRFLDAVAAIGALAMAAVAIGEARAGILAARLRDTVWALGALVFTTAAGWLPLAVRELFAQQSRGAWTDGLLPKIRAGIIAATLLFVFGALLRDADPIFASLVALPSFDMGVLLSHIVLTGFFAWAVAGWTRGALTTDLGKYRPPDALPFGLTMLDVTASLGTLTLLFGAFVLTQLGWFFGGERFLQARTGLTAAEYARQGFFQMLWVVLLVVPLLTASRAVLLPGRELARRHAALSFPLIGLLGAIILSAVLRMRLYVHYYGLTTDRFYPLVFMGWLAAILVWLAVTVLRDRGRPFIAGTVVSGLAVLAGLNIAAPDAIVARYNLHRVPPVTGDVARSADLQHMSQLSGDAAAIAVQATLAPARSALGTAARAEENEQRCFASRRLLRRWGPNSRLAEQQRRVAAWRTWNRGEAEATRVVAERAAELRAVSHSACVKPLDREEGSRAGA